MIIVFGSLTLAPGQRDAFLRGSRIAVEAARQTDGCLDLAVSPDLLDPDRVNVLEAWESADALERFRGDGPGEDLSDLIRSYDISQREISE